MKKFSLRAGTALTAGCLSAVMATPVAGQDQEIEVEEVVVTGTYLRGRSQADSGSPLAVVDATQLNNIGATTIADLVQTLTINSGSQNNPDAFTQNASTGTANFNLRGLGIASTLVLLNGRRQVVTATTDNDGVQFVDTNSLVPQIAIGRVEIVKDGAAALYGSDAVAGVVNILTDNDFEGFATSARYQAVTDEGSQRDLLFQAKYGYQSENLSVLLAASYMDRSELTTAERRLSGPRDDFSTFFGNPGSFIGLGQGVLPPGVPIVDPTGCEQFGGTLTPLAPPTSGLQPGFCGFDFGEFFNLVPEEERIQAYASIDYEFSAAANLHVEAAYADNEASRGNSPTFPILNSPVVGVNNPFNLFGEPVLFLGRAIGNGGSVSPQISENETFRISAALNGEINDSWSYDVAFTYAENNHFRTVEDTLTSVFQQSLGFATDPETGLQRPYNGIGDSGAFFNPFATSFTVAPNSPAVLDQIIGEQSNDATSELVVIDAVVSGELFELPAGAVGLAVGFQYRDESLSSDLDVDTNTGNFLFVAPAPIPDFSDSRSPYAIFAEMAVPLTDTLEFSGAVRFEDYGGSIGDTLDPKFALLWRPTDTLTLRGSFSTSFRAPSTFQQFGVLSSLNQVVDPRGGTAFAAIQTRIPGEGGRDIAPEQSEAMNFGLSWQPIDGLNIDVDYFDFSFEDAIVTTSFQEVVNANSEDPTIVQRSPAGSIVLVNVDFENANTIDTNGLDLRINYNIDTDVGTITPFFDGTWVFGFDYETASGTEVDGLGARNFGQLGTGSRPTPEFRFNTGISFANALHEARFFVRYIDGMDDNENPGARIDSMTTIDAQYALNLGEIAEGLEGARLTVGAINLLNEDPPFVATNGGFEARAHDPRGRVVYVELGYAF